MVPTKIIIITAPSGSGKTTLVKRLLKERPQLTFSISACTRSPRAGEEHGRDYYFMDVPSFKMHIRNNDFMEWEMVYEDKYYGTLKSELNRIWSNNQYPVVDIDVQGALNIQQAYRAHVRSIFIEAPSLEELERRLIKRGTETPATLKERLEKAVEETAFADRFDTRIINDDLESAYAKLQESIDGFLEKP